MKTNFKSYYVLDSQFESKLCNLILKINIKYKRIIIIFNEESTMIQIDERLWTFSQETFLPHGIYNSEDDAKNSIQPILLMNIESYIKNSSTDGFESNRDLLMFVSNNLNSDSDIVSLIKDMLVSEKDKEGVNCKDKIFFTSFTQEENKEDKAIKVFDKNLYPNVNINQYLFNGKGWEELN